MTAKIAARVYPSKGKEIVQDSETYMIYTDRYMNIKDPTKLIVFGEKTVQQLLSEGYAVDFIVFDDTDNPINPQNHIVSVQNLPKEILEKLNTVEEENPDKPKFIGVIEHIWLQNINGSNFISYEV